MAATKLMKQVTKTHQPLNRHVNKYSSSLPELTDDSVKPKERFTTKENFYHTVKLEGQTIDADVEVST